MGSVGSLGNDTNHGSVTIQTPGVQSAPAGSLGSDWPPESLSRTWIISILSHQDILCGGKWIKYSDCHDGLGAPSKARARRAVSIDSQRSARAKTESPRPFRRRHTHIANTHPWHRYNAAHAILYRARRRMLHKHESKTSLTCVFKLNNSQLPLSCQATTDLPTHAPGLVTLVSTSKWVTPQRRAQHMSHFNTLV